MIYLLDTNARITYLRQLNALFVQRLASKPFADLRICPVVAAEPYYGAHRSGSPARHLAAVRTFVTGIASLPFDDAAADQYGRLRTYLESQGTPIGPYDTQIAAVALAHGATLVTTHDAREFGRVPHLTIEDWDVP
jgi:tRNA(fMet)-specific endonuclease VapC